MSKYTEDPQLCDAWDAWLQRNNYPDSSVMTAAEVDAAWTRFCFDHGETIAASGECQYCHQVIKRDERKNAPWIPWTAADGSTNCRVNPDGHKPTS